MFSFFLGIEGGNVTPGRVQIFYEGIDLNGPDHEGIEASRAKIAVSYMFLTFLVS